MEKVTVDTIKKAILLMDEINGSDHYNKIDWDNPTAELPDFLYEKKDNNND